MNNDESVNPFATDSFIQSLIDDGKRKNVATIVDDMLVEEAATDYVVSFQDRQSKAAVKFTVADPISTKGEFWARVSVKSKHPDNAFWEEYNDIDVNFSSLSSTSAFATALNSAIGNKKDGYNWSQMLNRVGKAVRTATAGKSNPVELLTNDYVKATFLADTFLEKGKANVVFGRGDTGKTFLALYLVACGATGSDFLGKKTQKFRTCFIDYEDDDVSASNRLIRIAAGHNMNIEELRKNIVYYKPQGSVADEREKISRFVKEKNIDLILIDAGASATGGSPLEEAPVLKFFTSLDRIECTKLIIHHEPRSALEKEDDDSYYGTTYWRNCPRLMFRLKDTKESIDDTKKILQITWAKANNMRKPKPIFISCEMSDDSDILVKPWTKYEVLDEFEPSLESKIVTYLLEGEADLGAISSAVNTSTSTVERSLERLMKTSKVERKRDGKKYKYYTTEI